MSFFELFNGSPVDSLDEDHRIAFNKPAIKGSKNVTWVNFRTILSGFFMNLTSNQTVNGDKTFTGRIVGRTPLSDTELATKKYVDDNAGGGEEIIEVDTYDDLPRPGVNSVLYVVLDENIQYRWTGTDYIEMSNPLSYATQAEAEAGTENTKVMTSLRVAQQWIYNVSNYVVSGLTTTAKTIIEAINELETKKQVITNAEYQNFKVDPTLPVVERSIYWNEDEQTLSISLPDGGTFELNKEFGDYYTLLEDGGAVNGDIVSIVGATGNRSAVSLTDVSIDALACASIGMVTVPSIDNNNVGRITEMGHVHKLNTSGYTEGAIIYVHPTIKGKWTATKPTAPTRAIEIGIVVVVHATEGVVRVNTKMRPKVGELTDADTTQTKVTPTDSDSLFLFDAAVSVWKRLTLSGLKTFLSSIFRLKTADGDEHGFDNPPNDGNFTVSNTGLSYTVGLLANAGPYKINGTQYPAQEKSLTFTAVLGQNFACITDTNTLAIAPFEIQKKTKTMCFTLYTDGVRYRLGDELHTSQRNLLEHKKQHDSDGARYVSGGTTTFGAAAANTFTAAQCEIRDEDRYHTILAKTQGQMMYRNAAQTVMTLDAPSTYYAKVISNAPQYDNAGVLTPLGNSNYGITWMYFTNAKLPANSEIAFVLGQGVYASVALAESAPQPTIVGATVAEWKLAYKIIYRQNAGVLQFTQADPLLNQTTGPVLGGGGAGLTTLPASQVSVTPMTGYTFVDGQTGYNELAANTLKGNTTVHTTPIDADSVGVLDSVAGAFKRLSLLNLANYVLGKVFTSTVKNNSNMDGATLNDILNEPEAVEVASLEATDLILVQRPSQYNAKIPWSVFQSQLSETVFVSNQTELSAALALEKPTVNIFVTAPITGVSLANSYPSIIHISGESLEVDNLLSLNQINGTGAKFFIENRVYISGEDCLIFSLQNATMYFRYLQPERTIQVSGSGGAILTVNCDNSPSIVNVNTGTFNVNKNTYENSRLVYDYEGKSGYNIVKSTINENGEVIIQVYFTIIKGETINLTLLAEDCAYLVNFDTAKFTLIAFDQPQSGLTTMNCLVTLPRFMSNTVALAQSLGCSTSGERHVYRVADNNGDNYDTGVNALDIDLQASAYTCTITNTQVDTQNRLWYCMTLTGTATLKGRWYGL